MLERKTKEFLDQIDLRTHLTWYKIPHINIDNVSLYECPFCKKGKKTLYVEKNFYACLDPLCAASGNVVSFEMEYNHLSAFEAVKNACRVYGIKPAFIDSNVNARTYNAKPASAHKAMEKAQRYFVSNGTSYWEKRGIDKDIISLFGLGETESIKYGEKPTKLYNALIKDGVSEEALSDAGLISEDGDEVVDSFINRAIVPIRDYNGKIVAFGGRALNPYASAKYKNSRNTIIFDKSRVLFAMDVVKSSNPKSIILCEGYVDAIMMHQYGFTNTVASMGTALTTAQAKQLKSVCDKVIIMYDNDGAGEVATRKAVLVLLEEGITPYIVRLNGKKDPDEFLNAYGADAMKKHIAEMIRGEEYLLKGRNPKTAKEKKELFKDLTKLY